MGTYIQTLGLGLAAITAGYLITPQIASAEGIPDLVITTDSRIPLQGSCKKGDPLWNGTIAIKNIGTGTAKFGPRDALSGGDTQDYALVVYVPQNIDLIAKERLSTSLEPLDQKGIDVKIGEDRQKRCRFFNKPPRIRSAAGYDRDYDYSYDDDRVGADRSTTGGRIRALQRALISKGYPLPRYGVDGDYGTETRTALRAYYSDKGETSPYTGTTNISQAGLDRVLDDLGANISDGDAYATCSAGARSDDVNVTIYAVVDPYNDIAELNEANNSATFTVNMDCSGLND